MGRAPTQPGTLIGGKYRLDRLLGQGGMGSVFAAENMLTGKRVAIKCMNAEIATNAEASNRFLREAKASARIRHPNVVDVYDVLQVDGSFYLIMELLEGESLAEFLTREAIPLPRLLKLLLGAMRGVVAAHREGVIHRDVKPENIFLAREGDDAQVVPKVLDFGISKIQDTQEIALTAPGSALGTVLYMATEQLVGAANVDARADVYAFGVILYQVITGRLPFMAESFSALVLRIMTEQPVPVRQLRPDVPARLSQLIEWAMAKQRDDRLPSVEVLIHELEPFADEARFSGQLSRTMERPCFRPPPPSEPEAIPLETATLLPATHEWVSEEAHVSNRTPFVANDATLRLKQQRRTWSLPVAAVLALVGLAAAGWWLSQRAVDPTLPATAAQPATVLHPEPEKPVEAPPVAPAPIAVGKKPSAPVAASTPTAQPPRTTAPTPPAPSRPQATESRARPRGNVGAGMRPDNTAVAIPPAPAPAPVPSSAKKAGCNPNFFFDAQGEKHFKPECF